jgi:hypothetical protein
MHIKKVTTLHDYDGGDGYESDDNYNYMLITISFMIMIIEYRKL